MGNIDHQQEGKHYTSHLIQDILRQVGLLSFWQKFIVVKDRSTRLFWQNGPKSWNHNRKGSIEDDENVTAIHKKKVKFLLLLDSEELQFGNLDFEIDKYSIHHDYSRVI